MEEFKWPNIQVESSKKEEREEGDQVFKEIMGRKTPKFDKNKFTDQRSSINPQSRNMKEITPRNIKIKLLKTSDKENIL